MRYVSGALFVRLFLFAVSITALSTSDATLAVKLMGQQQHQFPANKESIAKGEKMYARYCLSCHGREGKGGPTIPVEIPNLVDANWKHGGGDADIFKTIKQGVPPDLIMESFEDRLSNDDIWHVIHYVRDLAKRVKK